MAHALSQNMLIFGCVFEHLLFALGLLLSTQVKRRAPRFVRSACRGMRRLQRKLTRKLLCRNRQTKMK